MLKKMYKFLRKYSIFFFIFLFIFFASLISFIKSDISLTTISHSYDNQYLQGKEINSTKKIKWDLTIKDKYFGILVINFAKNQRIKAGDIVFRVKESNREQWIITNTYSAKQLNFLPSYPFGLPVIADSNGKSYTFELSYKNGTDRIKLSSEKPLFISKHQYPKNLVLSSPAQLLTFLSKKVTSTIRGINLQNILLYIVPPLLYIFYFKLLRNNAKFQIKGRMSSWKIPFEIKIILLILAIDIIFIKKTGDIYSLILLSIWVSLLIWKRLSYRTNFLIASLLLFLSFILIVGNFEEAANKGATWTYYFLVIGTIQAIIEMNTNRKSLEKPHV